MKVRTMIAQKGERVLTIQANATIANAVEILHAEKIGALVVSDDGVGVEGILSERDVVRGLQKHGAGLLDKPVSSFMTAPVKTCGMADDIQDIMSQMTRSRIRHLPVVEDGKLRGMISIGDVVKNRLEELEAEANALRDYVTGRA
jgi:CBS domain-containing protein